MKPSIAWRVLLAVTVVAVAALVHARTGLELLSTHTPAEMKFGYVLPR